MKLLQLLTLVPLLLQIQIQILLLPHPYYAEAVAERSMTSEEPQQMQPPPPPPPPSVPHHRLLEQLMTRTTLTSRRLQQQQQQSPLVAATFEMAPFDAPIITIAMIHVPKAGSRSRKYLAYWRALTASQMQSAATFDLNTRETNLITTIYDQFCNGPVVLPDGDPAFIGGYDEPRNKVQIDGRKWITVYDENQKSILSKVKMAYSRWYPTPCVTADKKVLIVGGTAKADVGPQIPVAEIWNPDSGGTATPQQIPLPPTFKEHAWMNWYPFIVMVPRGEILWWGDRGGSITNSNWQEVFTFPPLPPSFPYHTMYWFTSSIVLHALTPEPVTGEYKRFSMTIFGGAPNVSMTGAPASPLSARLDMYYCGRKICHKGWVIEDMLGQRRVMATSTVLPNGKVLVHGGGQAGVAGWPRGRDGYQGILPAYQDLVYDPIAPTGKRYTLSATLGIIRMYHAASCLDLSGKVVSSGCETCGMKGDMAGNLPATVVRSPNGNLDFRISYAVPAEIAPPVIRPVIVNAPSNITRGSVFNVSYSYPGGSMTGATLAAPCANTHSISMNQRVVFLNVIFASEGVATIRAPPLSQPAVAHAGYYQLFLLGEKTPTGGRTYSEGIWIYLQDQK